TTENTFNTFWSIMDERYVYFEEKKLNWDSIFTIYSNKAKQIKSEADLKIMLQEILDTWNDDHVSITINNNQKIILSSKQSIKSSTKYYAPINKYNFENYEVKNDLFYTFQNRERRYGYIHFGDLNEIIPVDLIKNSLENLLFDKGLIVDLRRCGGGYLSCTYRVSELFYTGEKILFYKQPKTNKGRNDFGKLEPVSHNGIGIIPETTPIILLTDSIQYSAGNLLAFILNDLPNTITVGTTTTGGGATVQYVRLPNGWLLAYPSIKLFSTTGQNMEYGLKPDVFNSFTPSTFDLSKRDEHIAIALELLDSINGYEKVDYLEMYQ
ncbi:MAG TPA: S41 family peptidase, partial [Paludibacter sp.]|nr:S41 family peptidase [Paludibacter sp.]